MHLTTIRTSFLFIKLRMVKKERKEKTLLSVRLLIISAFPEFIKLSEISTLILMYQQALLQLKTKMKTWKVEWS